MKSPHTLFAILLAMCAVVAATFFIGEVPTEDVVSEKTGETVQVARGHGFTHPEFKTMQSGGNGEMRHSRVLWLGWAFGMLQIAFFVCLLAFGGQKRGQLGPLGPPLIGGGILFAAIFTAMVYSYNNYMLEDQHAMVLSLPIPTAWMIYGVWPIPIVFMALYMFTFGSWTFREEDMTRLKSILAEHQNGAGDQA